MHPRTRSTLLGLGLESDLVAKIDGLGHTVEILRAFGEQRLLETYTPAETALIRSKLQRTPIPPDTVERILERSGGCCCVCRDGLATRPYQLHHARPYAQTQDHSEANLILVCPTHHAVFHEAPIAESDQLKSRDSWYALRALAADFTAKGVAFPYGAFEPIDFSGPPDYDGLVELGPLTPATATVCTPTALASAGLALLKSKRSLMVIGPSGAGKSTYALGLAGQLHAASGEQAFRYLRRHNNSDSLNELIAALSCVAKPTLFIADDLNAWASLQAIEKLADLVAASSQAYLLATVSAEDAGYAERLSLAPRSHQFIAWENMRDTLVANLLAHEEQLFARLVKERQSGNHQVDLGHSDAFWHSHVQETAESSQSAYDLVFKVRGSREGARAAARGLADREGSHLPILAAALEQIAGFEQPVFPADVAQLLRGLPTAPGTPQPTADWVEREFERGVRQRQLSSARGAYTTVHRRWAADFIDECLGWPAAQPAARELIIREFARGFQSPVRLMRLFNWLSGRSISEPFCAEWLTSLGHAERVRLGHCMADAGLETFSYFIHQLIFLSREDSWREILRELLRALEDRMLPLVTSAGPTDWRSLGHLFSTLQHNEQPMLERLLAAWPPDNVARLIGAAPPVHYTRMFWSFSSITKAAPDWAAAVGRQVQWSDIKKSLESARSGEISTLGDLLEVLGMLRFTFMRSMSRDYLDAVGRVLSDAGIDDLHVGFVDTWLGILVALCSEDADRAFARIDHARWAREISNGSPRRWRAFAEIHFLFAMAGSNQIQRVLSLTDRASLSKAISRSGPVYGQTFRWLFFIVSTFDQAHRAEWSTFCADQVEAIMAAKAPKSAVLLGDFERLDPAAAQRLAARYGVTPAESHPFPDFLQTLAPHIADRRRQDEIGNDYDTGLLRWDESKDEPVPAEAND